MMTMKLMKLVMKMMKLMMMMMKMMKLVMKKDTDCSVVLLVCLLAAAFMQNEGTLTCTAMCATEAHTELFIFTDIYPTMHQCSLPTLTYQNENYIIKFIQRLQRIYNHFIEK